MRKLLFYILIVTAMLTLPGYSYSQMSRISGTVTDSSNKPLPFVTVRIFKPANLQIPLQTTLSAADGAFQFGKVDPGNYTVFFTHTGFAEKQQNITVKPGTDVQFDTVALFKTSGTLTGVVVKTQRPLVEQADDRIVFNV